MDFDYSFGVPVAIVQSDSVLISPRLKGLWINAAAAGTVKLTSKGVTAVIPFQIGSQVLPFGNITQVFDTDTTLTDANMFGIR